VISGRADYISAQPSTVYDRPSGPSRARPRGNILSDAVS